MRGVSFMRGVHSMRGFPSNAKCLFNAGHVFRCLFTSNPGCSQCKLFLQCRVSLQCGVSRQCGVDLGCRGLFNARVVFRSFSLMRERVLQCGVSFQCRESLPCGVSLLCGVSLCNAGWLFNARCLVALIPGGSRCVLSLRCGVSLQCGVPIAQCGHDLAIVFIRQPWVRQRSLFPQGCLPIFDAFVRQCIRPAVRDCQCQPGFAAAMLRTAPPQPGTRPPRPLPRLQRPFREIRSLRATSTGTANRTNFTLSVFV